MKWIVDGWHHVVWLLRRQDPGSLLNFYRELMHFRRRTPLLQAGDYAPLAVGDPLFAFLRFFRSVNAPAVQPLLVVLNFGGAEQSMDLSDWFSMPQTGRIVFSTQFRGPSSDLRRIELAPHEGSSSKFRSSSVE